MGVELLPEEDEAALDQCVEQVRIQLRNRPPHGPQAIQTVLRYCEDVASRCSVTRQTGLDLLVTGLPLPLEIISALERAGHGGDTNVFALMQVGGDGLLRTHGLGLRRILKIEECMAKVGVIHAFAFADEAVQIQYDRLRRCEHKHDDWRKNALGE